MPRFLLLLPIFFCLLPMPGAAEQPKPNTRPNVILIYSDDQGAVDLGCYGTRDITTPNIDRLTSTGVRFTQMYAPAPVCSASRAGLMTGKLPFRAGVPSNVSCTAGVPGMPTEEITIAELFKSAGYKTGHFGKWHLGYTPETMPLGQGFDESYGFMGGCIDNESHYFYWDGPSRHDLWRNGEEIFEPGRYFPARMSEECVDFIERNREEPFFIYLAYNVPHYPLQPTLKWREYYHSVEPLAVPFLRQLFDPENPSLPQLDPLTVRGLYAAFVSSMDEQIGRVIEAVEKHGLRDDTIIVFQADQGHSYEERTFWGGGNSGIFRGGKFSLFEGGIRVPSVVSCPGTIPQGRVNEAVVHACDWLPTLLSFCGITPPENLEIDGKNIRGTILENEKSPHETLYWQFNEQWALRKGNWKLYTTPLDPSSSTPLPDSDKTFFLCNLAEDPGERTNLREQHPEIVEELLREKSLEKRYNP